MTPLPEELLESPIKLKQQCKNVTVVEWRGSSANYKSLNRLNRICNTAVKSFVSFLKDKHPNYTITKQSIQISSNISIIPINSKPRSLNDNKYRFYYRSKQYDDDGNVLPIWGFFQRKRDYVYIRNDVLSSIFSGVYAHELFHVMSYKYGIFEQHSDEEEELMADEFAEYLGC